jgi:hypothetical protein
VVGRLGPQKLPELRGHGHGRHVQELSACLSLDALCNPKWRQKQKADRELHFRSFCCGKVENNGGVWRGNDIDRAWNICQRAAERREMVAGGQPV